MAKSFNVDVVFPEGTVWSGEAEFVVARTVEGEIGIMADHEPVMAALATGAVVIESGNQRTTVGVHGGFMQILNNQVTLITDRAQISTGDKDEAIALATELEAEVKELEESEPEREEPETE